MELVPCVTDADYEAWRAVRIAVLPGERCATLSELRAQDSANRLLILATEDGTVLGSGMADRSDVVGRGFVAPRVRPEHRRRGVGTALLAALSEHCVGLGRPLVRASVEDDGSLAFAEAAGFTEVDRQVEQTRVVGDEPPPARPPAEVDVVLLSEQPDRWAACYETFGREVLADFALFTPLDIGPDEWNTSWAGEPMFLALHRGEVIGCAGLHLDTDQPTRAENALTGVRRDWRGKAIASHLKRRTLHWAATHGLHEVYTWTQAGNESMLRLNEHLGYATTQTSITVAREAETRS